MIVRIKHTLLGFALTSAFAAAAVFALTSLASVRTANAQPTQGGQQTVLSSQSNWSDSLRAARAENEALMRILSSIESIDTARQNELIQWIITDRNIRSRVISALRKNGYKINPNSVGELTVTQKPPTSGAEDEMQLLRLVIESIGIYGEPNIRRALGTDLYERLRSRDYELTMISTEPVQQKIQFVYMDASLFGGDIIFKSGFGFGVKVGNDYIGYPFWLPGTIGTYGLLRRGTTDFRVGLEWPLGSAGNTPFTISGGLRIRERKLIGTMAFGAEIKQELDFLQEQSGKLHFGLEFFNAFTPSTVPIPGNPEVYKTSYRGPGKDSLFYLGLSAHGYVSYRVPDNFVRGMYVQLGGGMHSIQPVTLGTDPNHPDENLDPNLVDKFNYFDPFVKVGYVHTSETGDDYGLSVQYSNTMLADAWVKLFPWLQLEAKYSAVVGRDVRKWEWKDYVMVSPKLTLNF